MARWLRHVSDGLEVVDRDYPFLAYGTDWLAFAHLVIAVSFIGPIRDPVRNIWGVEFGMIACLCSGSPGPDLRPDSRNSLVLAD